MRISNLKGVKTCPGSETIKCNIDCSTNQNDWNDWTNHESNKKVLLDDLIVLT